MRFSVWKDVKRVDRNGLSDTSYDSEVESDLELEAGVDLKVMRQVKGAKFN